MPIAACDNAHNATRLAELELGIAIAPGDRTPERVAGAVEAVLHEASHRAGAARLGREIAALRRSRRR